MDTHKEPMRSRVCTIPVANSKYPVLRTITFSEARTSGQRGMHFRFSCRALEIMLVKCKNIGDAVKTLITGFWITVSVCSVCVYGQDGK